MNKYEETIKNIENHWDTNPLSGAIVATRKPQDSEINPTVNYCVDGSMSHCTAGTTWKEQKRCKHAEKSTVANRCMSYIESIDGHCDCLQAQINTQQK